MVVKVVGASVGRRVNEAEAASEDAADVADVDGRVAEVDGDVAALEAGGEGATDRSLTEWPHSTGYPVSGRSRISG